MTTFEEVIGWVKRIQVMRDSDDDYDDSDETYWKQVKEDEDYMEMMQKLSSMAECVEMSAELYAIIILASKLSSEKQLKLLTLIEELV